MSSNTKPTRAEIFAQIDEFSHSFHAMKDAETGLSEKLFSLERQLSKLTKRLDQYVWNDC